MLLVQCRRRTRWVGSAEQMKRKRKGWCSESRAVMSARHFGPETFQPAREEEEDDGREEGEGEEEENSCKHDEDVGGEEEEEEGGGDEPQRAKNQKSREEEDQSYQKNTTIKVFSFCRQRFPLLSRRELKECFVRGRVRKVGGGVCSEWDQLQENDAVEIVAEINDKKEETERKKEEKVILDWILFSNEHLAVVHKPPGRSVAVSVSSNCGRRLEEAVCRLVKWDNNNERDAEAKEKRESLGHLLYRPEKRMEGLCVIARDHEREKMLEENLFSGIVRLVFTAVLSGAVLCSLQQKANTFEMEMEGHGSQLKPPLIIRSLSCSRSRSARDQCLSLVEIIPRFDKIRRGESDGDCILTTLIRNISKTLNQNDFVIIGDERDDSVVKTDKGIFLALTKILWSDKSNVGDEGDFPPPFDAVEIPVPNKFKKLLDSEARLFHANYDLEKAVLAQHFTGNDYSEKVAQLDRGWPVEYLTGKSVFCGFEFVVTQDVMIPRRSSETLVHEALSSLTQRISEQPSDTTVITLLDVGTGSGCLLCSMVLLLRERFPHIDVKAVGIDISASALAVAENNASRLGLSSQVTLLRHDFKQLPSLSVELEKAGCSAVFDVIVCNPPYSASSSDRARLSSNRVNHEPHVALFSSEDDPTSSYDDLAAGVSSSKEPSLLKTGGLLVVELGNGQLDDVRRIFKKYSQWLRYVRSCADHNKLLRCIVFEKTADPRW